MCKFAPAARARRCIFPEAVAGCVTSYISAAWKMHGPGLGPAALEKTEKLSGVDVQAALVQERV